MKKPPLLAFNYCRDAFRHMGPPSNNTPSDFKKDRLFPSLIQTRVSAGCFPSKGAKTPRIPPRSTLTTYLVALSLAVPVEKEAFLRD
jgi:hypothetical protein